ncbi:hypothetical protein [Streptomyces sp. NPDC051129]|uniref:hypothetical protein n=1 Tax=Streptomyces sp. NPDC051129 TaxID=3154639 RepID=UPI00343FD76D
MAQYAAADGDDGLPPAVHAELVHRGEHGVHALPVLDLLVGVEDEGVGGEAVGVEVGGDRGAVEVVDGPVHDQQPPVAGRAGAGGSRLGDASAQSVGEVRVGGVQQVVVDEDFV